MEAAQYFTDAKDAEKFSAVLAPPHPNGEVVSKHAQYAGRSAMRMCITAITKETTIVTQNSYI